MLIKPLICLDVYIQIYFKCVDYSNYRLTKTCITIPFFLADRLVIRGMYKCQPLDNSFYYAFDSKLNQKINYMRLHDYHGVHLCMHMYVSDCVRTCVNACCTYWA